MSLTKESIDLLLATGRAQQALQRGDSGDAFFITPAGNPVGLTAYFKPTRVMQTVTVSSAESFCDYFKRFETAASLIFAKISNEKATFNAVLDYHLPSAIEGRVPFADYCQHRVIYETETTPEWKTWLAANRKAMPQVEFAVWLEDNIHLLVSPSDDKSALSGAGLLELVKSLHGHQSAQFNTALRLDNGAYSVKYEETVDVRGTIKADSLTLPPFIYGGFSLFEGTPPYQIQARLKTRIENRKLVLFFETVALERNVRQCLREVAQQISEQSGKKLLFGSP